MRLPTSSRLVSVAFGFALLSGVVANGTEKDEFIPLFNGRDLAGWKAVAKPLPDGKPGDPSATWSVKESLLHCTGKPNGYLATEKEYSNYVLKLKWRFPADAKAPNGGVLLHVAKPDRYWPHSIEAQMKGGFAGDIWLNPNEKGELPTVEIPKSQFDTADANRRHYFRLDKDTPLERPRGDWNEYEIVCQDGDITLIVNGRKANTAKNGSLRKGRIALQSEGAEVFFKDIVIAERK